MIDDPPPPTQGKLEDCKTVIWNGPMGVFEYEAFAKVRTQHRTAAHAISFKLILLVLVEGGPGMWLSEEELA